MINISLNTLQRVSVLGALNSHQINDVTTFNRASKILERIEITEDEKEKLNLKINPNGTISWGLDDDGKQIDNFEDIVKDIKLSDEMSDLLKVIIDKKISDGVKLSTIVDRALVDVYGQLTDPARNVE